MTEFAIATLASLLPLAQRDTLTLWASRYPYEGVQRFAEAQIARHGRGLPVAIEPRKARAR